MDFDSLSIVASFLPPHERMAWRSVCRALREKIKPLSTAFFKRTLARRYTQADNDDFGRWRYDHRLRLVNLFRKDGYIYILRAMKDTGEYTFFIDSKGYDDPRWAIQINTLKINCEYRSAFGITRLDPVNRLYMRPPIPDGLDGGLTHEDFLADIERSFQFTVAELYALADKWVPKLIAMADERDAKRLGKKRLRKS
jgi:hypothetical protein